MSEIDKLDWYSARQEGLGDLYEGLLQINAEENKSGAGQYFKPRQLIDSMVAVMQPTLEDVIQELNEQQQQKFYRRNFYGEWSMCRTRKAFRSELVPQDPNDETARVLLEKIRAAHQAEAVAAQPSWRGLPRAAVTPDPIALEAAPVPADFLTRLLRECGVPQ